MLILMYIIYLVVFGMSCVSLVFNIRKAIKDPNISPWLIASILASLAAIIILGYCIAREFGNFYN